MTKKELLLEINKKPLPKHIAIILDGNGRWAQKRGLTRNLGHKAGAENLYKVLGQSLLNCLLYIALPLSF